MSVGHDLTIARVNARIVCVIALACLKSAVLSIARNVVGTANTIEDVLAKVCSVCVCRITCLEAERIPTHEVGPFDNLFPPIRKSGRKKETTHWVATQISTVRVQFTSIITGLKINHGLVNESNSRNVSGRSDPLYALEGTLGNQASPTARLGAPCNHLAFPISDSRIWLGRSPETKIVDAVEKTSLAERVWTLSRRVALVVAILSSTNEALVSISLVRDIVRVLEMFRSQRNGRESACNLLRRGNGNGDSSE